MLEYGEAYLELNEKSVRRLEEMMTPAVAAVAREMAPEYDDEDADQWNEEAELEAA